MDDYLVWYCPLGQWLAALADGWQLPVSSDASRRLPVVESMKGHHGAWSVLLTKSLESGS